MFGGAAFGWVAPAQLGVLLVTLGQVEQTFVVGMSVSGETQTFFLTAVSEASLSLATGGESTGLHLTLLPEEQLF